MSSKQVPDILNQIACAGDKGLSISGSDPDLELCRTWSMPLGTKNGRARLVFDHDVLVPAWIESETPAISWDRLRVLGFFEIGSTNEEASLKARQGAPEGLLVYAEKQTSGRGRKGRHWNSPAGTGLYFSLLLTPANPLNRWPLLTHVASVSLAQVLNELSAERWIPRPLAVDLKWPNDVLLSGKKTAGILLETVQHEQHAAAAVLGVGINVKSESLRDELKETATSVSAEAGVTIPRRRLLVRYLYHFQIGYELFKRGQYQRILDQWKTHSSMWDGVPVWLHDGDQRRLVVTCGLSDMGALKVRASDGTEETVLAADVSVRHSR
jgi:BirA family transcriptional regulator, biotin operon repressor / biotin---[acetyl-CoA-carboxylase] ligase